MQASSENQNQHRLAEPERPVAGGQGVFASLWFFLWDFLKVFLIALAIIIPVRFYLFQPFIVTGQSMQPTIKDGEYLIIDEISYRFSSPARGQVVVVHSPQDSAQFLIKRIIGLPGETVEIANGKVVVKNSEHPDGVALNEQYLTAAAITFGTVKITLNTEQYFVLGDNRLASSDSRIFGPVLKQSIVGKVLLRAYPLNRFDMFTSPQY